MKKLCVPEEVLIEIVNALEQGLSAQDIIQQYEFSEEHRACWRLPGLESSNDTENNTLIHLQPEFPSNYTYAGVATSKSA
ncbi:MAG: hypothetical protein AB9917_02960 [Negativicutes bacterium]